KTLQLDFIGHVLRFALNHHVDTLENVAARDEYATGIAREILRFALTIADAEVDCVVEPDAHQWCGGGPPVWTHCRQPIDLRLLQALPGFGPRCWCCTIAAEPGVQLGNR